MLKKSFYKMLIAIFVAFVFVFVVSIAYTKLQQRKVYFSLFEDAHVKAVGESPVIAVLNDLDDFSSFVDNKDVEQQISKSFKAFLSAQQLRDVKYLDQYFSDQALKLFSDKVMDEDLLVFLNGNLNVDFVQQNGSLLFLSGKLNYSSTSTERSNIRHATLNVRIILKKYSFNYKISNFIVMEEFEAPRTPRELSPERFDGVNYYPVKFPWSKFWENFDPDIIDNDFKLISDLNANSVRVFLTYEDFNADRHENYDKLIELLKLAENHSLRVMITLFDLKPDYSLHSIQSDILTLLSLHQKLKNYDFDIIFDLKNEIDLDFSNHETWKVKFWLGSLLYVISNTTNIPVTIGWSKVDFALDNLNEIDVISYHDYNTNISVSETRLNELKTEVLGRPIYITEVGETSAELVLGIPANEKKQADKLRNRLNSNSVADGISVWTLFDYSELDDRAIGRSPWLRLLQKNYGLFNQNYELKLSGWVVKEFFTRRTTEKNIE